MIYVLGTDVRFMREERFIFYSISHSTENYNCYILTARVIKHYNVLSSHNRASARVRYLVLHRHIIIIMLSRYVTARFLGFLPPPARSGNDNARLM